jgi:hypothetical protein
LPFLLLRNGFRSIEKTDQLRTEKITHPQDNQQNFARVQLSNTVDNSPSPCEAVFGAHFGFLPWENWPMERQKGDLLAWV